MSHPPWMLLRLALETASYHAAADEDRLAAMNVTSVDAYRAHLVRIFGFESSFERAILQMRDLQPSFVEPRLRSVLLREDLRVLGLSDVEISAAACAARIHMRSGADALGWMFVLERQMLVAGLIRRHLQRTIGDGIRDAMAYWSAYGSAPGARFRSFADGVTQLALRHPPKLIVAGAIDAFRAQRQWYSSSGTRTPNQTLPATLAPRAAAG